MHEEIALAHVGTVQQGGRIELRVTLERRQVAVVPARQVDLLQYLLGQGLAKHHTGRQGGGEHDQAGGEGMIHCGRD